MSLKSSRLLANLLIIGSLSLGAWGCSSSSDDGGGGATGSGGSSASSSKAGSGGSSSISSSAGGSSGGASSSSKASGGSSAVGGSSNVGGSSSGGKSTEGTGTGTGGSSKGGTGTGTGTGTGGTGTGTGTGTGGTVKGGTTGTGGAATGGTATGGAATGGTGGTANGGTTATGGTATGGAATGGSGTGGSTGTGKGSPGCGIASPLKTGEFKENIKSVDRQWFLDVPSGYDTNKPTRLVFVWHPLMGTASDVKNGGYNGLKALSNNTTIFVAPNGLNGSNSEASGNGWWNKDNVDMLFLEAMLKKINEGLCIDQERIFTTGFSFGGMMSYTIPWVFEGFRATAPCSGKVDVIPYTSKFEYPIPIMAFHGASDGFVKTALGKQFLEKFRTRNKCGTETKKVDPSPCIEYQGCTAQTIWCEFPGEHVQWAQEPAAIWKFFSQF